MWPTRLKTVRVMWESWDIAFLGNKSLLKDAVSRVNPLILLQLQHSLRVWFTKWPVELVTTEIAHELKWKI